MASPRVVDGVLVDGRDGTPYAGAQIATNADLFQPDDSFAHTVDRRYATANDLALGASGELLVVLAVLPGGVPVTKVCFFSGALGADTPTHQWAAIYDGVAGGAKLAVSADRTTDAWAAGAEKQFTLTTPYTPAVDRLVYLGLVVTTDVEQPNTMGPEPGQSVVYTVPPIVTGIADTGLTTPATAPATLGTVTPSGELPWAFAR